MKAAFNVCFLLGLISSFNGLTYGRYKTEVVNSQHDHSIQDSTFSSSADCANLESETVSCQRDAIFCRSSGNLQLFTSRTVSSRLNRLLNTRIEGGGDYTAKSLRNEFVKRHCELYVVGGALRDILLDRKPEDIDLRSNCSFQRIEQLCHELLGPQSCRGIKGKMIVLIRKTGGSTDSHDIPLDLSTWRDHYDFYVNHLFYSFEMDSLIDVDDGRIVRDVCHRWIRIPSGRFQWPEKIEDINTQRYWKLIHKGFNPIDDITERVITEKGSRIAAETSENRLLWPFCLFVENGELRKEPKNYCRSARKKRSASYPNYSCGTFNAVVGKVMSSPLQTLTGTATSAYECTKECLAEPGCRSIEYYFDGSTHLCKLASALTSDTSVFSIDLSTPARLVYELQ